MPVVGDDGLLTGIVSRSDLLDAFVRPDVEIRNEVEQDVLGRILGLDEGTVAVDVRTGSSPCAVTSRNRVSSRSSWASARASTVSSPWMPTSPPPGRARRLMKILVMAVRPEAGQPLRSSVVVPRCQALLVWVRPGLISRRRRG
nr:hypothetical protein [Streptomyces sp. SCUT-3]